MKKSFFVSILAICVFHNYSYSQNLTIFDFERILKLDLTNTNTELNKFGLSFASSREKDSTNCKVITWDKSDNCMKIECLFSLNKYFCEDGVYSIIAKFYTASYYNNFKLQLEKNRYKFKDAFTEDKSLVTYYINNEKKLLISLTEERIEGFEGDSEKTKYSIAMIGR
jgi:hypothetical protein